MVYDPIVVTVFSNRGVRFELLRKLHFGKFCLSAVHNISRHIVECNTDVQAPAYLRRDDMYDLSSIAVPNSKAKMKPFHSLDEDSWPNMEALGLDESQMRALQMALTKELAIIQGPPGTGKTSLKG